MMGALYASSVISASALAASLNPTPRKINVASPRPPIGAVAFPRLPPELRKPKTHRPRTENDRNADVKHQGHDCRSRASASVAMSPVLTPASTVPPPSAPQRAQRPTQSPAPPGAAPPSKVYV